MRRHGVSVGEVGFRSCEHNLREKEVCELVQTWEIIKGRSVDDKENVVVKRKKKSLGRKKRKRCGVSIIGGAINAEQRQQLTRRLVWNALLRFELKKRGAGQP